MGMIGGVLIILGTTIKALDDILNNKQEMIRMEGLKLYEIKQGMIDTLDIFLESEGSDLDQENYAEVMIFLRDELKNKSSSLLKYIQDLKAQSKMAKEEADRLKKVSEVKANKIERLKSYLINTLQVLEIKKIETDLGSYGIRKNPLKVDVYDETALPEEFIRVIEERKPDKEKIKEYIKANGELKGVRMVESYSLQIR